MSAAHKSAGGKQNESGGIQVIARAADILRVLRDDNSGLSLGKIAKRVDLPRSTVQRIINALLAENLVSVGRDAGGYVLGSEIIAMAQAAKLDVAKFLQPYLGKLSSETGETVDLAIYKNRQMVFVDQVVGSHRLRAVSAIGDNFPMTVTANGKAVMTLLDSDLSRQIYEQEKSSGTTGQSYNDFLQDQDESRKNGYALDIDEHTSGISAVGVSFSVAESIYAISIPAPSHRFATSKSNYIEILLHTMAEIVEAAPEIRFRVDDN